jgi:hypothetical protein
MRQAAVLSFALVTVYYSFGIYTAYYTHCGYEAYAGGKCILPVYKNLEKEGGGIAALNDGERLNQTFTNLCGDWRTWRCSSIRRLRARQGPCASPCSTATGTSSPHGTSRRTRCAPGSICASRST